MALEEQNLICYCLWPSFAPNHQLSHSELELHSVYRLINAMSASITGKRLNIV